MHLIFFLLTPPLLGGLYRLCYSAALGNLGRPRLSRRDRDLGADRGQQILVQCAGAKTRAGEEAWGAELFWTGKTRQLAGNEKRSN